MCPCLRKSATKKCECGGELQDCVSQRDERECVRAGVGVKESERGREREVKGTRKD